MAATQSNVQVGAVVVLAYATLEDKEGYLAELINDNGTAKVQLPSAVTDLAIYLILEGAAAGQRASVQPLESGRNVRVKLKGTCNPGDKLCLADVATPADAGKVRTIPSANGTYYGFMVAEEVGVDGQLVKARYYGREAIVVGG